MSRREASVEVYLDMREIRSVWMTYAGWLSFEFLLWFGEMITSSSCLGQDMLFGSSKRLCLSGSLSGSGVTMIE